MARGVCDLLGCGPRCMVVCIVTLRCERCVTMSRVVVYPRYTVEYQTRIDESTRALRRFAACSSLHSLNVRK